MDTRHDFGGLWHTYLGVSTVVVAVVFSLVAVALVRSRGDTDGEPVEKRPKAELVYGLVLAAIAAGLVGFTFHTESKEDPAVAEPTRVDVAAFKWGWSFTSDGRTVTGDDLNPPTLTVPAGRPIEFTLTSRDVIHAFWVPELRFKRDAFPFRTTRFDLVFDRRGVYVGRCAEFCGLQHAGMTFRVRVT